MTAIKQHMKGIIVSKPSGAMAVVECARFIQHAKYHKFFKQSKKYHAEDPKQDHQAGDAVIIESTRPLSRTQRWRIIANA